MGVLELTGKEVDDAYVEVVAAESRVAAGGKDVEDAVANAKDRDVERAAAEVEHDDALVDAALEAIGQRGRRRFVDDAFDGQSRNRAGVLGGLTLRIIEVGGNGDDGPPHWLP